jgi:hypothetical protein
MHVSSPHVIHVKIDIHPNQLKRPAYFYKYVFELARPLSTLQIYALRTDIIFDSAYIIVNI